MTDIQIDLDDPRTTKIAVAISNKTSKKILATLAEKELSETELSNFLKLPMNTIGYNIKKLESAGLIEKTKKFLWSVKGRRVHKYKVSNKRITISPKSMIRGIIPTVLISTAVAFGIKLVTSPTAIKIESDATVSGGSSGSIPKIADVAMLETTRIIEPVISSTNSWKWFLLGSLVAILIFLIWNSIVNVKRIKN
jgi:predicted transcriptional regulator